MQSWCPSRVCRTCPNQNSSSLHRPHTFASPPIPPPPTPLLLQHLTRARTAGGAPRRTAGAGSGPWRAGPGAGCTPPSSSAARQSGSGAAPRAGLWVNRVVVVTDGWWRRAVGGAGRAKRGRRRQGRHNTNDTIIPSRPSHPTQTQINTHRGSPGRGQSPRRRCT